MKLMRNQLCVTKKERKTPILQYVCVRGNIAVSTPDAELFVMSSVQLPDGLYTASSMLTDAPEMVHGVIGIYPIIPVIDAMVAEIDVKPKEFGRALAMAGYQLAQYYLNGVLCDFAAGVIIASDGHRLYKAPLGSCRQYPAKPIIMPRAGLGTALRAKCTKIKFYANGVIVGVGKDVEVVFKAIDGNYPDYARVLAAHRSLESLPIAGALHSVLAQAEAAGVKRGRVVFEPGSISIVQLGLDLVGESFRVECSGFADSFSIELVALAQVCRHGDTLYINREGHSIRLDNGEDSTVISFDVAGH